MLDPQEVMKVKGRGFLRNRGTDCFSGRMVPVGTVFTPQNFKDMATLAETFGSGKLICTSRQTVEIPGIPFEKIEAAEAFAAAHGLAFGGTGAKIRPITACKGTTCVFGNVDTHALAAAMHREFYEGWRGVTLPHKFKIGIGGCPNSCIKPSLNDFGVEGCRTPVYTEALCRGCKACAVEKACPMGAAHLTDGKLQIDPARCNSCGVCTGKCAFEAVAKESAPRYRVFVGGTWGKTTRMGTPLSRLVREEEVLPLLEKCLLWFRLHGYAKERFGKTIDRVGIKSLEAAVFGNDILAEKHAILAAELKTKA
ncbi:MAG: (4Fe-4S)-binding protein [Clostridia bacterium]|nr:(4Fe-4S)-binding protein [Clostridia bacterium]